MQRDMLIKNKILFTQIVEFSGEEFMSGLRRNIVYLALLIGSCLYDPLVNAQDSKLYLVSSIQVLDFLANNGLNVPMLWENFSATNTRFLELRSIIAKKFEHAIKDKIPNKDFTILDLLIQLFGKRSLEKIFPDIALNDRCCKLNKLGAPDFVRWKLSGDWAEPLNDQDIRIFVYFFAYQICLFLDDVQNNYKILPQFWVAFVHLFSTKENDENARSHIFDICWIIDSDNVKLFDISRDMMSDFLKELGLEIGGGNNDEESEHGEFGDGLNNVIEELEAFELDIDEVTFLKELELEIVNNNNN